MGCRKNHRPSLCHPPSGSERHGVPRRLGADGAEAAGEMCRRHPGSALGVGPLARKGELLFPAPIPCSRRSAAADGTAPLSVQCTWKWVSRTFEHPLPRVFPDALSVGLHIREPSFLHLFSHKFLTSSGHTMQGGGTWRRTNLRTRERPTVPPVPSQFPPQTP